MSYTPLDDGITMSTVSICGGPVVLAVWTVIMASTDQDGVTKLTPRALEALWSKSRDPLTLEAIEAAWEYLASPDEGSANKDHAGRRIVPTDDGRWLVVSHEKYRERHSGTRYRALAADRQARKRDRDKGFLRGEQFEAAGRDGAAGDQLAAGSRGLEDGASEITGNSRLPEDAGSGSPACPTKPLEHGAVAQSRDEKALPPAAPSLPTNGDKAAYARAIADKALEITGNLTLSSVEFAEISLWWQAGIPLRVVLTALSEGTNPAPGVTREPRSLRYFDAIVREEWERVQKAGTV